MNRILFTLAVSTALSFLTPWQSLAEHPHHPPHGHHHGHHPHHETGVGDTPEEMAQKCEQHLEQIKVNEVVASLPADKKAEVDYNLKIAAIEAEALKDPNHHKDYKRHAHSCHRHLKEVWRFIKEREKHVAREKKEEERHAKAEERKAKAEERKAEREAEKAKKEAEKTDGLDHGRSEGASHAEPGAEAAKPLTEEKK